MPPDGLTPERALRRLRQLAREEQVAVAADDVEALCRIAALLPAAMESLQDARLPPSPLLRDVIAEAQAAHAAAEAYLAARMAAVSETLRQCARTRRAALAYSVRTGASRLDEQK